METRSHESKARKGLARLAVFISAAALVFAGSIPAHALSDITDATGSAGNFVARVEIPKFQSYQGEITALAVQEGGTPATWSCPPGYKKPTGVTTIVSATVCEASGEDVSPKQEPRYVCPPGYKPKTTLNASNLKCYKEDDETVETPAIDGPFVCPPGTSTTDSTITATSKCRATPETTAKPIQNDNAVAGTWKCPTNTTVAAGTVVKEGTICSGEAQVNQTVVDVCSGTLIDNRTIVTSRACVTGSKDPYQGVIRTDDRKGNTKVVTGLISEGTPRVTFGTSSMPGSAKVYWGVSIKPKYEAQLVLLRLDRPVTGITPLKKPTGMVTIADKITQWGWKETAGTPTLGSRDADVKMNHLVNASGTDVMATPGGWDDFTKTPQDFTKEIGSIDNKDVQKGFTVDDKGFSPDDRGAPLVKNGTLAGIYINKGIYLDAAEPKLNSFLFGDGPTGEAAVISQMTDTKDKDGKITKSAALNELEWLQAIVCATTPEGSTYDIGGKVDADTGREPIPGTTKQEVELEKTTAYKIPTTCASGSDLSDYKGDKYDAMDKPVSLGMIRNLADKALKDFDASSKLLDQKLVEQTNLVEAATNTLDKLRKAELEAKAELKAWTRDPNKTATQNEADETKLKNAARNAQFEREDGEEALKKAQANLDKAKSDVEKRDRLKDYLNSANGSLNTTIAEAEKNLKDAQDKWDSEYKTTLNKYLQAKSAFTAKEKQLDNLVKVTKPNLQASIDAQTAILAQTNPAPTDAQIAAATAEKLRLEQQMTALDKQIADLKEETKESNDPAKEENYKVNFKPEHDAAYYHKLMQPMIPLFLEAQHEANTLVAISDLLKDRGYKYQPDIDKQTKRVKDAMEQVKKLKDEILQINAADQFNTVMLGKQVDAVPQSLKYLVQNIKGEAASYARQNKDAYTSINQALDKLNGYLTEIAVVKTTDDAVLLADKAGQALSDAMTSITTARANEDKIQELFKQVENVTKGGSKPLTPDEQKKAEEEAKKKAEAEKKAAEEAAKKAEADKKKAEADAKKKAEEVKKAQEADAKRLAKALSANTQRVEGDNRVLTSIAAWKAGGFSGDSVIIVDGNVAADGLSATPLAAALRAPILLTTWSTGLEPAIVEQLKVAKKKHVILVGGKVQLSPYDRFELTEAGYNISQIAGADRFETSVKVARRTMELVPGGQAGQNVNVYLADGIGFPDALASGAAAGRQRGITLLTSGNQVPWSIQSYLTELGSTHPMNLTAVGGPAATAMNTVPLPNNMSVVRNQVVGVDRYETAAKLAATVPGTTSAVLVSGENFPDALSGGALAANINGTIVLTQTNTLPSYSEQALRRHGADRTIVVGGEKAVSRKVAELVNGAKLDNITLVDGTLASKAELARLEAEAAKQVQGEAKDALAELAKKDPAAFLDWVTKVLNTPLNSGVPGTTIGTAATGIPTTPTPRPSTS
ncbi:MAG: cell wall-binding repeat-containing protein [Actinomycetaceae bacterium]|nr:cell wall-binding repeat-containing protein [Actinomycetaceae bacterium]